MIDLSVVICTHNPRRDVLSLVLAALKRQTLASSQWELIVVDNNSQPPLDEASVRDACGLAVRVLREPRTGLVHARRRGVDEAGADVLVMVDDDNILDPDYLQNALDIAHREPAIGAFGGMIRPILEYDRLWKWQRKMLPYLGVRDYGGEAITSKQDTWGRWEPVGAGMVVRRDVAGKYAEFVDTAPLAARLGRNGPSLMAAEDALLARAAYRLGYSCSYQPRLKLSHYISRGRLRTGYLFRLLYGHGRSAVTLDAVLGRFNGKLSYVEGLVRLPQRCLREGLSGAICWAWDLGYFVESRAVRKGHP